MNTTHAFQGKINDDYVIFLLTDGLAVSECSTGAAAVAAAAVAVDDNPNPVPEWLSDKSWRLIQRASSLLGLVYGILCSCIYIYDIIVFAEDKLL